MSFRLTKSAIGSSRNKAEKKQPLPKLFFIAEGAETEIIYLKKFKEMYSDRLLGNIIIFDKIDTTRSNQLFIVNSINSFLQASINIDESILTEIGEIKEEILTATESSEEEITQKIHRIDDLVSSSESEKLFEGFKLLTKENSLEFINALVELQGFEVGYDKIIIVIDRDRQSFKPYQYDQVVEISQKQGFVLGITNPCFEFFLLLHLNNPEKLNLEDIKKNKKIGNSKKRKTYVEDLLNKAMNRSFQAVYKKSDYDAEIFINRFNNLSFNASSHLISTQIKDLKENVGTSLHKALSPYIKSDDL